MAWRNVAVALAGLEETWWIAGIYEERRDQTETDQSSVGTSESGQDVMEARGVF